MLYLLGAVGINTRPFNAESVSRSSSADFAVKPVVGGLAPAEFMGEGSDTLTISGQLLPAKIGGMVQLTVLQMMRKNGVAFPVMRGDGKIFGSYVVLSISENHEHLMGNGVGFVVRYTVTLQKVPDSALDVASLISSLVSLFG